MGKLTDILSLESNYNVFDEDGLEWLYNDNLYEYSRYCISSTFNYIHEIDNRYILIHWNYSHDKGGRLIVSEKSNFNGHYPYPVMVCMEHANAFKILKKMHSLQILYPIEEKLCPLRKILN